MLNLVMNSNRGSGHPKKTRADCVKEDKKKWRICYGSLGQGPIVTFLMRPLQQPCQYGGWPGIMCGIVQYNLVFNLDAKQFQACCS